MSIAREGSRLLIGGTPYQSCGKNEQLTEVASSPSRSLLGEWSVGTCIEPDGSDYVEGANLSITTEMISGFEWSCDLSPKIRSGVSTYRGKMTCYGDTDDTVQDVSLEILQNGKLKMFDGKNTETLNYCR